MEDRVEQLERVAKERDQLLERIGIKKDQLLVERDQLLEKVRERESRLELMEKMAENCKRLVKDLPTNSPYCCLLLAYLVVGLENSFVMEFFGISKRTLDRIFEDPGNKLVETKYAVNVKRERVTQEQLAEIQKIYLMTFFQNKVEENGEPRKKPTKGFMRTIWQKYKVEKQFQKPFSFTQC